MSWADGNRSFANTLRNDLTVEFEDLLSSGRSHLVERASSTGCTGDTQRPLGDRPIRLRE